MRPDPSRVAEMFSRTGRWYSTTPAEDMEAFMDSFETDLLTPYPSIYNAVGLDRNELNTRISIRPNHGSIRFKGREGTDITIDVGSDNNFIVSGKLKGEPMKTKQFKWRGPISGIHRGVRGDIVHYIETQLPGGHTFVVCNMKGCKAYADEKAMARDHKITGRSRPLKGIKGLPHIADHVGPMYNGVDRNGTAEIRYDTGDLYNAMTR